MQMPGRVFSSASYRYGFNGKENDNDVKGIGGQQDYGMRIYDPRLGKFLSVDPLSRDYPWYTPYQFAGDMPIWAIDLDGLEPALRTPGQMMRRAFLTTANDIQQKWSNSRTGKFSNGLVNSTFGTIGTIASITYIVETGGVGSALGGGVALTLSLGEIGIGFAQMADAIGGKQDGSTNALHNSSSIPGLIAFGTNSNYASFVNAFGALGPSIATSFGVKTFLKDPTGLKNAFNSFVENPNILNTLGAIDQALDVYGFAVESATLINDFGNDGKSLISQTLNYKMSYTMKKGDNLSIIAKRLNTTVEILTTQNNIKDPENVNEGTKIFYSSSDSKVSSLYAHTESPTIISSIFFKPPLVRIFVPATKQFSFSGAEGPLPLANVFTIFDIPAEVPLLSSMFPPMSSKLFTSEK